MALMQDKRKDMDSEIGYYLILDILLSMCLIEKTVISMIWNESGETEDL